MVWRRAAEPVLTNNPGNRQVSASPASRCRPSASTATRSANTLRSAAGDGSRGRRLFLGRAALRGPRAMPRSPAAATSGAAAAPTASMFEQQYGYEMPRQLTMEVKRFRHDRASTSSKRPHARSRPSARRAKSSAACTPARHLLRDRKSRLRQLGQGRPLEACDVFSTTILSYQLPRFFRSITQRTLDIAHKYGKGSQRWLMNYYQSRKTSGSKTSSAFTPTWAWKASLAGPTAAATARCLPLPRPGDVEHLGKAFGVCWNGEKEVRGTR